MKITAALISVILLVACNFVSMPINVLTSFSKSFPAGKEPQWSNVAGNYKVNFKINNLKMSATYDSKGNWLETEAPINFSELPATVSLYLENHYKGINVNDAGRVTKENGEINYETGIKGKDLVFDITGNFIKEEAEE